MLDEDPADFIVKPLLLFGIHLAGRLLQVFEHNQRFSIKVMIELIFDEHLVKIKSFRGADVTDIESFNDFY